MKKVSSTQPFVVYFRKQKQRHLQSQIKNAAENGLIKELVLSKRFGQDPKLFTMSRVNKLNELSSIVEYVKKQATNT